MENSTFHLASAAGEATWEPMSEHNIPLGHSRFETELAVRPDDIDMNQHVHNSRYFDYVLAARYDQMARCYGLSMEGFLEAGFGWVVRSAQVEYKRPLVMGDVALVTTWVDCIHPDGVTVGFEIRKKSNGKLASDGSFHYTMIDIHTGRAAKIPDAIAARYAV